MKVSWHVLLGVYHNHYISRGPQDVIRPAVLYLLQFDTNNMLIDIAPDSWRQSLGLFFFAFNVLNIKPVYISILISYCKTVHCILSLGNDKDEAEVMDMLTSQAKL